MFRFRERVCDFNWLARVISSLIRFHLNLLVFVLLFFLTVEKIRKYTNFEEKKASVCWEILLIYFFYWIALSSDFMSKK